MNRTLAMMADAIIHLDPLISLPIFNVQKKEIEHFEQSEQTGRIMQQRNKISEKGLTLRPYRHPQWRQPPLPRR